MMHSKINYAYNKHKGSLRLDIQHIEYEIRAVYIYRRIYRRSRVGSTVIELVQKLLHHESHRCASTMISADLYRDYRM